MSKKIYGFNDTFPVRFTEKAGTTEELLDQINNEERTTQTIIMALKYWYATEGKKDRKREAIIREAEVMEIQGGRYGENRRSHYKKQNNKQRDDDLSIEDLEKLLKEKKKNAKPASPSLPEGDMALSSADEELYGAPERTKKSGMRKALASIPSFENE